MNATDDVVRFSATFAATVDLPDPEPPAIPIIKGFSIVIKAKTAVYGMHCAVFCTDPNRCPTAEPNMKIRAIAFSLLILGAACKTVSRGSEDSEQVQAGPTILQVDNQGFLDMNVYAARNSQRVRLGTASGNNKTNFRIPSSLVSGITPLHFVADPIGGRRASVSQEINVAPGDTVVLTIPPV